MNSIAPMDPAPIALIPRLQHRLEAGLIELRNLLSVLGPQSKPKQIHDIRIATRRQRALCRLLSANPEATGVFGDLEIPLKELTKALSSVRSWDVSSQQLKDVERHWQANGKKGIRFLRKLLKKQTRQVRRNDLEDFPKDQYFQDLDPHELTPAWDLLSPTDLEQDIHGRVRKSSKRVLKKWQRYQKSESIADLHVVRIGLKNLRYLLEIEECCFDHPKEKRIHQLKLVQDRLGYIHDLSVLQDQLGQKFIRKKIPKKKKSSYHQVQKYLAKSMASALQDFHGSEGVRLPLLLQGDFL